MGPLLGDFLIEYGLTSQGSNASRRTRSTMEERQTDMYRGMNEVPRSHGPTVTREPDVTNFW